MSKPWDKSFNADDVTPSYRGDLDPEKMVWLQSYSCNVLYNHGEDELHSRAAKILLINIPSDIQDILETPDYKELYYKKEKVWKSVRGYSSDPKNPFIINKREDIDYDPEFNGGEPLQISPIEDEEEHWDCYVLQKLIMRLLQERGLTWKLQRIEKFTGEEWDPAFEPEEEDEGEDESKQPKED